MTIESDIVDLLDDGRARPSIAIAECLPQHKAASVFATVSSMAGKSTLVKIPGKGFTLPAYAPADAVGPDWAAPNIAPFTRVLLYVRRHQPVKRSTVARVLKNHVADVGRVITECIGIGHVHQIGDMLREGADPRRAKVVDESAMGPALSAAEVETATQDSEAEAALREALSCSPNVDLRVAGVAAASEDEPDAPTNMTLLEGLERYEALAAERGITHAAPVTLAMLRDDDADEEVVEPPPTVDAAAILNDSHAIDQEPAMHETAPTARTLQPGEIALLLSMYFDPNWLQSDTSLWPLKTLRELGLVEVPKTDLVAEARVTDRGRCHVEALCATPLPVAVWQGANGVVVRS